MIRSSYCLPAPHRTAPQRWRPMRRRRRRREREEARDAGPWRGVIASPWVDGGVAADAAQQHKEEAPALPGGWGGGCEMAVSLLTADDDKCLEMGNFFSTWKPTMKTTQRNPPGIKGPWQKVIKRSVYAALFHFNRDRMADESKAKGQKKMLRHRFVRWTLLLGSLH